jgi:hypothetical protein
MALLKRPSDRSPRPGRRRHRVAKIIGIVALALVALVLVSASINLILTRQEKSRFAPYDQRVSVDGGSIDVWRNGHAGPTMVLLSGLGTAAPGLDFAPPDQAARSLRDRRAQRRTLPALDAVQGDGRQDHRLPRRESRAPLRGCSAFNSTVPRAAPERFGQAARCNRYD